MAGMPLAEFGFAGFGEFEFAKEDGALLTLTSFKSSGEASALFDTLSVVSTALVFSGSSSALFEATAIANTYISPPSEGGATAKFTSGIALMTSLHDKRSKDFNPRTGYSSPTVWNAGGSSTANFWATEGNDFAAVGRAEAVFYAGTEAFTSFTSSAESRCYFDAVAVTLTELKASGTSEVIMPANGMANGSMVSLSNARAVFPAYIMMAAGMKIEGVSSARFPAAAVKAVELIAHGKSLGKFNTQANVFSTFSANGNSLADMHGTAAVLTSFDSDGTSRAIFKPGSQISKTMPRAWDVMIRPAENRKVVWR